MTSEKKTPDVPGHESLVPGYAWIVARPDLLGGQPAIRGTRISVAHILECLAGGMDFKEISEEYGVPIESFPDAMRYAASSDSLNRERKVMTTKPKRTGIRLQKFHHIDREFVIIEGVDDAGHSMFDVAIDEDSGNIEVCFGGPGATLRVAYDEFLSKLVEAKRIVDADFKDVSSEKTKQPD